MSILSKTLDNVVRLLFYAGVTASAVMAALILISALARYLLGSPISFSDELASMLFVFLAFSTFPYVLSQSEHIRLSIITEKLSKSARRIANIFASVVFLAFATVFIVESYSFMNFSKMINSHSEVSGILLWPWMALMPISLGLCFIIELRSIFRTLFDKNGMENSL